MPGIAALAAAARLRHEVLLALLDGQHLRGRGAAVVLLLTRVPEHVLACGATSMAMLVACDWRARTASVLSSSAHLSASGRSWP
jgi:hypothetical protein